MEGVREVLALWRRKGARPQVARPRVLVALHAPVVRCKDVVAAESADGLEDVDLAANGPTASHVLDQPKRRPNAAQLRRRSDARLELAVGELDLSGGI